MGTRFINVEDFKIPLFKVNELESPVTLKFQLGIGLGFANEFEVGSGIPNAVSTVPEAKSLLSNPNSKLLKDLLRTSGEVEMSPAPQGFGLSDIIDQLTSDLYSATSFQNPFRIDHKEASVFDV